jgi:hypothetical protein
MGGRSKSSSTQQSGLDPELRRRQLANIDQASGIAGNLQARQFAGMSSGMTDAMGTARALTNLTPQQIQAQQLQAQNVSAQQVALGENAGMADAMSAARGVSQFTPEQIQAQQVRAGSFLNKNLQDYMNPFQQGVIDTTLSDIERSRQLGAQAGAAQAMKARAFGGSRHGVAQAETNRAFAEQAGRSAAQLRAQGFEAATGLMGQDLTREQQANLANQQASLSASQSNQQAGLAGAQQRLAASQAMYGFGEGQQRLGLQASQANQDAALRASLANQSAGLQAGQLNQSAALQAAQANQSADLNAAQQRAAAATQLYGMGSQEQQLEQSRLDAERNLELERQQIRNQALGLNVGGGSGMQSTGSSRSSSFNISPF